MVESFAEFEEASPEIIAHWRNMRMTRKRTDREIRRFFRWPTQLAYFRFCDQSLSFWREASVSRAHCFVGGLPW